MASIFGTAGNSVEMSNELLNPIKAQRARATRACCFFMMLVAGYLCVALYNIRYIRFGSEVTYAQKGLKLEVMSCDVFVESGDERMMIMDGLLTAATESILQWSGDDAKISSIKSSKSCNDQPFLKCEEVCKVTIKIPKGNPPEELWIYQSSDDTANNVRVHITGVTLKTLWIKGPARTSSSRAGPTIEVHVKDTTITGEAKILTKKGNIALDKVKLPDKNVDIRSESSISLLNIEQTARLDLRWRQPMNAICVTPSNGHLVLPNPTGLFGLCQSDGTKFGFQSFYDQRKDYKIDNEELQEQIPKLPYCCGGRCPHKSSCTGLVRDILPWSNDNTAYKDTVANVFDKVVAQGYPGLVPGCHQQLMLTHPVNGNRTATGYPEAVVPSAFQASTLADPTTVSCQVNEDCLTGYCNSVGLGATFKCGPNPSVTPYQFQYSWSACTKPCGGGQQVRQSICVGSDGIEYPLKLCGTPSVAQVQVCNVQACQFSAAPSTIALSNDVDLREGNIKLNATVDQPIGAHKVIAYLGTATAMLDPAIAEISNSSCNGSHCVLNLSAELASYIDRVYVVGANDDGNSAAITASITDMVGEPTAGKWSIHSSGGRITLHSVNPSPTPWSPEEGLTGIKLQLSDAQMLMQQVGPKVGDPSSTEFGYIVIHTVEAPGLPRTTWIYSPQLVHFAVDPAYLNFFSGGMLSPDIYEYRVHFQDNVCPNKYDGLTSWDFENEDHQARLIEMFSQLAKALRSDGKEETLRGRLMVLSPDEKQQRLARDSPVRWAFYVQEDGSTTIKLYEDGWLELSLGWAILLSLSAGILFSILATTAVRGIGREALATERSARIRYKKLLARKAEKKIDTSEDEGMETDPFKNPLLVIQVLVVSPLRKRIVNSLARFVDEYVEVEPVHRRRISTRGSGVFTDLPELGKNDARAVTPLSGNDDKNQHEPIIWQTNAPAPEDAENGQAGLKPAATLFRMPTRAMSTKSGIPFTTMRTFRYHYEKYCIDQGLNSITSQETIMRSLVKDYKLRATQTVTWRLKGVKWREPPLVVESPTVSDSGDGKPVAPVPPGAMPAAGDGAADNPLFSDPAGVFCDTHLEITRDDTLDWVEYTDRYSLKGDRTIGIRGFKKRYFAFCKGNNIPPPASSDFDPTNPGNLLADWCHHHNVLYQEVSKMRIKHCTLLDRKKPGRGGHGILMELFHLFCTLVIMDAPGVSLLAYVTNSQVIYARTLALKDGITWYDVYGNVFPPYLGYCITDKDSLFLMKLFAAWQLTYITLATIGVLFHYTEIDGIFKRWMNVLLFYVFYLEVIFFLAWVGTICCWCILAAVLDPKAYLGVGTAVATLGLVVLFIWREMRGVIKNCQQTVMKAVNKHMQSVLRQLKATVMQKMHEEAAEKLKLPSRVRKAADASKPAPVRVNEAKAGFDEYHAEKNKPISVSDVFMLLDEDQNGELSTQDFQSLFQTLGGKMKPSQIEQLFAICDVDGTGRITQEELEDGWQYIIKDVVATDMAELGATTTDIIIAIVLAVAMLLCLFAFIFFALRGWTQRSSFEAVVQGLVVSASGKLVTHVRKKVPAEKGNLDDLVGELEKEANEDDGEDN